MAEYIYDKFQIVKKVFLTSNETESLTTLYMPLMGIDSFALYMLLLSYNIEETFTFKQLLDGLNFSSMKVFNQSLEKLEALALVKTYEHSTKGYAFELHLPLDKEAFLNNEALRQFLMTQIGETQMQKIESKKEKKLSGYKNITKKFSDVFRSTTESIENIIETTFTQDLEIENKDFNYTLFKFNIDFNIIPEEVLEDLDFRKRIERISFTYNLDEDDMRDVVMKTIDIDKNFEYASIVRNASIVFQKKYKASGPAIETIKEDSFVLSGLDDKTQKIINIVESFSIAETLENVTKLKPSPVEIKMFDEISLNTGLPIAVINILIIYVSKTKKELPGYNYFEKIALNWSRANIKTAYDAIKHINEKDKSFKKPSYQKEKQVASLPDWYEEYEASLKEKPESAKTIVSSNREELINLVKDMFN